MLQTNYFLGANSPTGFYSLYDELSHLDRLYILKGGPGCGKSTLMRRVATHAEAAGMEVERILCSGDPDSLDAVILPAQRTAIVDGTAPHVVEASCPGAVETYVDLSCFYEHNALKERRVDLTALSAEYKGHYRQAYRCLGAAGELEHNLNEAADSAEVRHRLEKRAKGIISRELKKSTGSTPCVDRRFLTAITHRGVIHLWSTVTAQADRIYELSDRNGLAHHLLSPILSAALTAGHRVVACPDPMAPKRLAHLILPDLSLAFVTSTPDAPWPHRPYRHLRLDAMESEAGKQTDKPRLRFTRKVAEALTEEGIHNLARAKEAHDRLEAVYNPHVNFDGVLSLADQLAAQIIT